MSHRLHTTCYLAVSSALLMLAADNACAQLAPVNPIPSVFEIGSGQLGHWYLSRSSTFASVYGASAGADDGFDNANIGLAQAITKSVSGEYDTASAYAAVTPTKLSAAAFSNSEQLSIAPGAVGISMASASFFTILDRPGTITLHVNLSGFLNSLTPNAEAGVAMMAIGSGVDDNVLNTINQAGSNEDASPLETLKALPRIDTAHAQVFSAFHRSGIGPTLELDQPFTVSADGFAFACPPSGPGTEYCGKYGYGIDLLIQAVSVNSASSDFAHTLAITGLDVPEGSSLTFDDGAAIPVTVSAVPEVSTSAMSLLGLGMVAGLTARRRQRG